MSSYLDRLVLYESDIRYQQPAAAGEAEFDYRQGSIPVLLSAPHGAVHTRKGQLKYEDEFTAAFSLLVADLTGAHVLYARRKSATDPNWYADAPYKKTLEHVVRQARIGFVLDLHGAAARRPFGIALGTMMGASCPEHRTLILHSLHGSGFQESLPGWNHLDVDHTFPGAGIEEQETVTRFTSQSLGVPAAQCELNAHLRIVRRRSDASLPRPFQGDPILIERAVSALSDVVRALSS